MHHQVPIRSEHTGDIIHHRAPTWKEIGEHFGGPKTPIKESTLTGWWKTKDKILGSVRGAKSIHTKKVKKPAKTTEIETPTTAESTGDNTAVAETVAETPAEESEAGDIEDPDEEIEDEEADMNTPEGGNDDNEEVEGGLTPRSAILRDTAKPPLS
jgi:hypothetical protein